MSRFRRRRYLIDPLQVRLLVQTWVSMGLVLFACGVIVFVPLILELRSGEPSAEAAERFLALHRSFWPVLGLLLLAAGLHSILSSHRIVGPLLRLRNTLDAIADGRPPERVTLREKDYLQREAEALNRVLARLRELESAGGRAERSLRDDDRDPPVPVITPSP